MTQILLAIDVKKIFPVLVLDQVVVLVVIAIVAAIFYYFEHCCESVHNRIFTITFSVAYASDLLEQLVHCTINVHYESFVVTYFVMHTVDIDACIVDLSTLISKAQLHFCHERLHNLFRWPQLAL